MIKKRWNIFNKIISSSSEFAVKLFVPAQIAKAGPPIGPVLILAGIDVEEFCRLSNVLTSFLQEGVKVPVKIFKCGKLKIELESGSVFFSDFILRAVEEENEVNILLFYQLYILKCFLLSWDFKFFFKNLKNFVGILFSLNSSFFFFKFL